MLTDEEKRQLTVLRELRDQIAAHLDLAEWIGCGSQQVARLQTIDFDVYFNIQKLLEESYAK